MSYQGKKINVHINIIVATSILEEGLDVKSCNLAIRFDPCHTMCSFIQSRGCARMQNSDYILMVKRFFFFFLQISLSIIITLGLGQVLIIELLETKL